MVGVWRKRIERLKRRRSVAVWFEGEEERELVLWFGLVTGLLPLWLVLLLMVEMLVVKEKPREVRLLTFEEVGKPRGGCSNPGISFEEVDLATRRVLEEGEEGWVEP